MESNDIKRNWVYINAIPSVKIGYLCMYALVIITLYTYNGIFDADHDYIKHKIPECDIAHSIKCKLPYRRCDFDILTGWSFGRVLIFTFCGLMMPDKYANIVLYSTIVEVMTHSNGGAPKVFTNIGSNIVGYVLGSQLNGLLFN